jgi:hypothetical protein
MRGARNMSGCTSVAARDASARVRSARASVAAYDVHAAHDARIYVRHAVACIESVCVLRVFRVVGRVLFVGCCWASCVACCVSLFDVLLVACSLQLVACVVLYVACCRRYKGARVSCVCLVCVLCVSCVCLVCVLCVSCVCLVCVLCVSCVCLVRCEFACATDATDVAYHVLRVPRSEVCA